MKIIVQMAAQRDRCVLAVDAYVVVTWLPPYNQDPFLSFPVDVASKDLIIIPSWQPGHWTLCDVPKQIGSVDCGVFMLMYALCMALGEPFHFTASNMQRIRKWWCLTLMNSGLEKHGLRKTEEASHLEPLSRESRIMRDLCSAVCWIHKNHSLFRGEVTEPAVLQMEAEDQREALREVLEGQSDNRNDPFMFIFNNKEDMETLLSNCVDRMGLKIHAMFT
ncbi:uncharacterized protein [Paramormyrops kingsleyae]|uniref:uncharacterized protein isoform X2 n=1 Tax=Paramormyrops kingsleyae TaxID=1676925 RepID=UPI003B976BD3